jgi:hypothetical protein
VLRLHSFIRTPNGLPLTAWRPPGRSPTRRPGDGGERSARRPAPQRVSSAVPGMATRSDPENPVHTQAFAWQTGGRPVAALRSTTMDRIWFEWT